MAKKAKRAVSPVLATLMMVAVAVAMSVIIFTWSQSFLSQTGEAASGQQASQNIAAQSGILIESATFSGTTATVYVRNVGSVSVTLGQAIAIGRPGQGFTSSVAKDVSTATLPKGQATTIDFSGTYALSGLTSGDVVTFKVTTKAGTFAQATYTVP